MHLHKSKPFTFLLGALLVGVGCSNEQDATGVKDDAIVYQPNLVVTALETPYSVAPYNPIDLTVTVCNQGNDWASNSDTLLVVSTDTTITSADTWITSVPTNSLAPGQCDTQSVSYPLPPLMDGAYYIGAIADESGFVIESDETDNTLASDIIGIGYGPDPVVTAISAPPSSADGLPVVVTVCNRGTDPAGGVDLTLYLSTDTTIEDYASNPMSPDFFLSGDYISNLYPGECTDLTINGWVGGLPTGAYYIGAVVDEWNFTTELIESNQVTVDGPIGIGWGPDLVTTAVDAPAATDGYFDATVTICNVGTDISYGADASLYLSEDTVIESPMTNPMTTDMPIGGVTVSFLAPGQCEDVTQSFWAPTGLDAPYIGVLTDEFNTVAELIESNNTFVGDRIGVGYGPDIVVETLTYPPSADGMFSIVVRACNQGTDYTSGFNVDVYASTDATIEGTFASPYGDYPLAGAYFSSLYAGQCAQQTVQAYPPGLFGPHYIGAIADEGASVLELNEYNNVYVGAPMGFGYGSDLVVSSVVVPPSADGQFEVDVTVCNQGTAQASYTDVELYLSSDLVLSTGPSGSDFPIGGTSFATLYPMACATQSVIANVYGNTGPYYVGAIVDPFDSEQELIETNNEAFSGIFGVGYGPDLVVTAIDAPPSTDGQFSATITVCNQGTASSSSTDVELILTLDDVIETYFGNPYTQDFPAGGAPIPTLNPGQCTNAAINGYAPAPSPAHYLAAIVDPYDSIPELVESNNDFLGDLIGIGYDADLIVSAIAAPPSANGNATITVTACNQGTAPSSSFDVELYVSEDQIIEGYTMSGPPVDTPIGGAYLTSLNPGACASQDVLVWLPAPDAAWYLGAIADPFDSQIELIESNNTFLGPRIGLGSGPDLVVQSVTGPASANGPFDVVVTVCNQGTTFAGNADVEIYASEDLSIQTVQQNPFTNDFPIAWANFSNLQPGACGTQTTQAAPPPWTGAGYLAGIVDPYEAVTELDEENNVTFDGVVGFGNGPDFIVTAISGPPSSTGTFNLAWTVCNQGTQAGATDVTLYQSDDAVITSDMPYPGAGDTIIGSINVSINADDCASGTLPVSTFGQGAYYLGAIADEYDTTVELIETNNTFVGGQIGIGNDPDLVVSSVAGPPSTTGSFTIDYTVCNQGTTSSPGTDVNFYLVTGETLVGQANNPYGDPPVANDFVPTLPAGDCHIALTPAYAPQPGTYRIGAIVDEWSAVSELIETNNGLLGPQIGVGNGPDLIVESVTGPAVTGPGAYPDFVVRVCNQGTAGSTATNGTLYLSNDATIEPFDAMLTQYPVNNIATGACEDVLVPAPMPPYTGSFFVGAIVDDFDSVPELIETNNASSGTPIELAAMFCGDGSVDPATEECDDGNGISGDGCSATCFVEHTVWQENQSGPSQGPYNWNYAMGFHFTPTRDGEITQLGGYFYGGPKTVRLFERDTGVLLAETQVAGQANVGQFSYGDITTVPVTAGTRYTVAVYLAGTGGTRTIVNPRFPVAYGDITIDASTYIYTGSNPDRRPTNSIPRVMYGQADIRYAPTE